MLPELRQKQKKERKKKTVMGRGERGTEKAETLALDINYTERVLREGQNSQ